jgi:hypothetical protein
MVRIGPQRGSEFMEKVREDDLVAIETPIADEAYWYREGQAVFLRKGDVLVAVHVVREDGIDRAQAIQDLAVAIAGGI